MNAYIGTLAVASPAETGNTHFSDRALPLLAARKSGGHVRRSAMKMARKLL